MLQAHSQMDVSAQTIPNAFPAFACSNNALLLANNQDKQLVPSKTSVSVPTTPNALLVFVHPTCVSHLATKPMLMVLSLIDASVRLILIAHLATATLVPADLTAILLDPLTHILMDASALSTVNASQLTAVHPLQSVPLHAVNTSAVSSQTVATAN